MPWNPREDALDLEVPFPHDVSVCDAEHQLAFHPSVATHPHLDVAVCSDEVPWAKNDVCVIAQF